MRKYLLGGLVVAGLTVAAPQKSFGLAALAAGAKTSCKPTAPKGTPLYQSQVNCDPLNVTAFQLEVQYVPSLVQIVGSTGLNNFSIGVSDPVVSPNGTASVTVRGSTTQPTAGENDDFGLLFELLDHNNINTPVPFMVFATGDDFINAIDTDNGNAPIHYSASQIDSSSSNETFAQTHGVPEPASAGIFAVIATAMLSRRKRSV